MKSTGPAVASPFAESITKAAMADACAAACDTRPRFLKVVNLFLVALDERLHVNKTINSSINRVEPRLVWHHRPEHLARAVAPYRLLLHGHGSNTDRAPAEERPRAAEQQAAEQHAAGKNGSGAAGASKANRCANMAT
jgi:hypothetical protein